MVPPAARADLRPRRRYSRLGPFGGAAPQARVATAARAREDPATDAEMMISPPSLLSRRPTTKCLTTLTAPTLTHRQSPTCPLQAHQPSRALATTPAATKSAAADATDTDTGTDTGTDTAITTAKSARTTNTTTTTPPRPSRKCSCLRPGRTSRPSRPVQARSLWPPGRRPRRALCRST